MITQPSANREVLICGLLVGLLAFLAIPIPPYPFPAWVLSAFTVAPFERWWYSLADSHRSKWLYDVGTTLGTAVYPLLVAAAFWLIAYPLRQNQARNTRITMIAGAILAIGSAFWYTIGWHYGSEYQGFRIVLFYAAISTCWLLVVFGGLVVVRRTASWWGHLALLFSLFIWAVTFAFPWLGEMP